MSRILASPSLFVHSNQLPESDLWFSGAYPRYNNSIPPIEWLNLWPSSRTCGLNGAVGDAFHGQDSTSYSGWYEFPRNMIYSGMQSGLCLDGITRDSSGVALGICTIQCFVTSTDTIVGEVVSGTTGEYVFITPYNVAHYLVAYKAGSPDVTGNTVNTLIPTSVRTY